MCTPRSTSAVVLTVAFLSLVLHPGRASADPVAVNGFLSGDLRFALVQQQLDLRITQPNRILFDGTFVGSAVASVVYENRFSAFDTRLGGYQFEFTGVATTPEPASLVLLGTGLVWLSSTRRFKRGG